MAALREALAKVPLGVIPAKMREDTKSHIGIDWHSLRHSVRTLLGSRGHRDVAIGNLLGQKDPATLRRYDHALDGEGARIADDVARFMDGDGGKEESKSL